MNSGAHRLIIKSAIAIMLAASAGAAQTTYPSDDGTLVDGGIYGDFDGIADGADWYFNQSSYEGSITLTTPPPPEDSVEHRLVWEYNLSSVSLAPPVSATLTFTIRGAPVWPFPDVDVFVLSYPADLQQTLDDFHSGPTAYQGSVTITPYQPPTEYSLKVDDLVSQALASGADKVALRFQVDPDTEDTTNQAFIDALDSNPTSKPYLSIALPRVPGDFNGDGDVDLDDFAELSPCLTAPCTQPPCVPHLYDSAACGRGDFDNDGDIDLTDFAVFQLNFGDS